MDFPINNKKCVHTQAHAIYKIFCKSNVKVKKEFLRTSWRRPVEEAAMGCFNLKESLTFRLIQPIDFILTFMLL